MLKFGFVGVANTILSYTLYVILIQIETYYIFASAISFVTGTIFSYVLNSRYTFKNTVNVRIYIRFLTVSLVALCMSLVILFAVKSLLQINVYLAQISVVLIRFPIVYTINRDVVFGKARGAEQAGRRI